MADRYWVSGSGTWSNSSTANWSTSSGGSSGASAPTSADNVFFDANSNVGTGAFTVTTSSDTLECLDLTISGLDGVMTISSSVGTLNAYGNVSFPASNLSGTFRSVSLRGTSKTLTTNNTNAINGLLIESGASYTLSGNITIPDNFTISNSTFNLGSNQLTSDFGIVTSSSTLTAGSATVTTPSISNNLSSITIGTLNTPSSNSICSYVGPATITTLNVNVSSSYITQVTFSNNLTIGTLGVDGGSTSKRVLFRSASGSSLTVTTLGTLTNTGWENISLLGAASPWSAPIGVWNFGGNSGITFNTSTMYWIGGTGDATDGTKWSTSSGGSAASATPGPQNPVVFNVNSNVGTGSFTVTAGDSFYCNDFTASGLDGALTFALGTANIYGSFSSPSSNFSVTGGSGSLRFVSNSSGGTKTINTSGVTFPCSVTINPSNVSPSTYQFSSNATFTNTLTHSNGTLDLNNYSVSCTQYSTSKNITFNGGVLTVSAGATFSSGASTTAGSGSGKISFTQTSSATLSSVGITFNCELENAGSGALTISGNNTITTLSNTTSAARTFNFTAGTTQTVTNFSVSGTPTAIVSIRSTTPGVQATLSKSSGIVSSFWLDLKDSNATGGATWNAVNSTDSGNNTGWVFLISSGSGLFFGSNF